MAIGTDKELFGQSEEEKQNGTGRPQKDRALLMQLIREGYSTRYIKRVFKPLGGVSNSTIYRAKKELEEAGELKEQKRIEELERVGVDFEVEIKAACNGLSFYDWLHQRCKRQGARRIFNFCKRTWESIWNRPSVYLMKDSNDPTGAQCCDAFLKFYGEDEKRIRSRKKQIRFLFRFLGRQDLNDLYLTMSVSRDPIAKREIPAITNMDFPIKLNKMIEAVSANLGEEYGTALRFKLVTMMRTGNRKAEREFLGLKKDTGKSWLSFENEDRFKGKVLAKRNEEWGIDWIPSEVRKGLYAIYQQRAEGEPIFDLNRSKLSREVKKACKALGLPALKLHDLRKVTITWFWAFGIDLSIATELNVGWKDLNTAKEHYLTIGDLIRRTDRQVYRDNIPEWFKDGLEEYLPIFFTHGGGVQQ